MDFYSSEIKRKKEKKKGKGKGWNFEILLKSGEFTFVALLYLVILLYFVRSEDMRADVLVELGMEFCTYFFRTSVVKIRDSFFFKVENLISLLFEYLVILLFVRDGRYAKWNRRSDTFDLSFLYLSEFYLPFFFFFLFFYICDLLRLLFGTSNETTRGDYKIIL